MQISTMSLDSSILDLGALLGTNGSDTLIRNINQRCGNQNFFGSEDDPFREGFRNFMHEIVQPLRDMGRAIEKATAKIFDRDQYTPIVSRNDLKHIPPCMHLPLIYSHPLRKLLEEERIDGWGINPKDLEEEDPYERCLNSGAEIHSSTLSKDGEYELHIALEGNDEDPAYIANPSDRAIVRSAREYIKMFLEDPETKHLDPTDYPNIKC